MAELHVQRKPRSLWWLWLIIILIIAAVLYFLYTNYYDGTNNLTGAYNLQFNSLASFANINSLFN